MDIPVTFEFEGKQYQGTLSLVSGGAGMWHLYVEGADGKLYFKGQLFKVGDKWRFASQSGKIDYLGEEFGKIIEGL